MRARVLALLVLALLVLVPSASQAQTIYVAPSRETVLSSTEVRSGNRPTHDIFVENRSSVPITVTNVQLTECENVRDPCVAMKVSKKVRPGGKTMVLRVQAGNLNMGFRYRFWYQWRPDSTAAAAIADAITADTAARDIPTTLRYKDLAGRRLTDVAPRIAALRAEPETLVIQPGKAQRVGDLVVLALDSAGQVLGRVREIMWAVPRDGLLQQLGSGEFVARQPGRAKLRIVLGGQARQAIGGSIPEMVLPVLARIPVEPGAPVFAGVALDADSRRPLGCARVALEDSAGIVVADARALANGMYALQAPRPGSYRVRVDLYGWASAYGPMMQAATGEEKQLEVAVRFEEQLLGSGGIPDYERARPVSIRTSTTGDSPSRDGRAAAGAPIGGVTLGGTPAHPVLGVSGTPAMSAWIQFTVDSTGGVDTTSVIVPREVPARPRATIMAVMRRLRFAPAKESGAPTCELVRMQVDIGSR